jgi:hypothetical protein
MQSFFVVVPGGRVGRMQRNELLQLAGRRRQDDLAALADGRLRREAGFHHLLQPAIVDQRDVQFVALHADPGKQVARHANLRIGLGGDVHELGILETQQVDTIFRHVYRIAGMYRGDIVPVAEFPDLPEFSVFDGPGTFQWQVGNQILGGVERVNRDVSGSISL